MKSLLIFLLALVLGIVGTLSYHHLPTGALTTGASSLEAPLYWQAPMDANYRRDEPGLSPMGMPLVPIYAAPTMTQTAGSGVVTISAAVENNLGVRTQLVVLKPLEIAINTVGYVGFDQDRLIHIHPRVEG